ncbi:MAG: acyltransferase family protein [Burkholderiaceae bacterium]
MSGSVAHGDRARVPAAQPGPRSWRTDIQALRGLAIALVVWYHAELGSPVAGYLGVDVFFVVSGFLVTRIVIDARALGTFGFGAFWFRRAMRLLPAAYVCFAASAIAATRLLESEELRDFGAQLLGATGFGSNIVLWRQTGYFAGEAALKPLLHTWSLAIEEQFYLLLPLVLAWVPRQRVAPALALLSVVSLAACVAAVRWQPVAAFYLLPTRAWELGLGALAASTPVLRGRATRLISGLYWPSIALLVSLPFAPSGLPHPGFDALIVCIATLVVLLDSRPRRDAGPMRGLARIGNASYSLYLVHWPVFAFATNAWVVPVPSSRRLVLVGLSLLLAAGVYRWVETPFRRLGTPVRARAVVALVGSAVVIVALGAVPALLAPARESTHGPVLGLASACDQNGRFEPALECRRGAKPARLLWGDSFAMMLAPAFAADPVRGLVQATMSECGPLLDIAPVFGQRAPAAWAARCMAFNDSVLEYLARTPSIDTVVLASPFAEAVDGNASYRSSAIRVRDRGTITEVMARGQAGHDALARTVGAIRALGRRVVIVAPPPSTPLDAGRCLRRRDAGLITFGDTLGDCRLDESTYRHRMAGTLGSSSASPRARRRRDPQRWLPLPRRRMRGSHRTGHALPRRRPPHAGWRPLVGRATGPAVTQ